VRLRNGWRPAIVLWLLLHRPSLAGRPRGIARWRDGVGRRLLWCVRRIVLVWVGRVVMRGRLLMRRLLWGAVGKIGRRLLRGVDMRRLLWGAVGKIGRRLLRGVGVRRLLRGAVGKIGRRLLRSVGVRWAPLRLLVLGRL